MVPKNKRLRSRCDPWESHTRHRTYGAASSMNLSTARSTHWVSYSAMWYGISAAGIAKVFFMQGSQQRNCNLECCLKSRRAGIEKSKKYIRGVEHEEIYTTRECLHVFLPMLFCALPKKMIYIDPIQTGNISVACLTLVRSRATPVESVTSNTALPQSAAIGDQAPPSKEKRSRIFQRTAGLGANPPSCSLLLPRSQKGLVSRPNRWNFARLHFDGSFSQTGRSSGSIVVIHNPCISSSLWTSSNAACTECLLWSCVLTPAKLPLI